MVQLCSIKRDNWESDFPIICEECLGESPYIQMQKYTNNEECKLCTTVFSVYCWKPKGMSRMRKTEICPRCAQNRNLCQSCVLDLDLAVPAYIRDSVLPDGGASSQPVNEVMRNYVNQQQQDAGQLIAFGTDVPIGHAPSTDTIINLAKQIKPYDRTNTNRPLYPPEDKSITSFYIGGVTEAMGLTERDLRDFFYPYGRIKAIKLLPKQNCAFITYQSRDSAELCGTSLTSSITIRGNKLKLLWAKPKKKEETDKKLGAALSPSGASTAPPVPKDPRLDVFYFPPMPGQAGPAPAYQSMQPQLGFSKKPAGGKAAAPKATAAPPPPSVDTSTPATKDEGAATK